MTSRVRVPLHQQAGRFVSIDPKATEGAVVGVNVLNADGALWVPPVAVAPEVGEPEQTLWELILKVPPNIIALEEASGTGFFTVTGVGTGAFRTIEAVAGETTSANENGVSGNPTIGLADVPDLGDGAFLLFYRDAKGRVVSTTPGTAADVPYDNAASGLLADDVQAAIDELSSASVELVYNRIDAAGDIRIAGDGSLRITN